jgi:acetolactate synthase-1/2/3 large subunit
MCDPAQVFAPKLVAKKLADGSMLAPSLENMSPFLSDEEMAENTLKD